MNNMKKEITSKLEVKFINFLGNIAKKMADSSEKESATFFVYEPEFPKELLEITKEEN